MKVKRREGDWKIGGRGEEAGGGGWLSWVARSVVMPGDSSATSMQGMTARKYTTRNDGTEEEKVRIEDNLERELRGWED